MKTVSLSVMNLCVPCENRCRYCLLAYDGKTSGLDYARSQAYGLRFHDWLKANRPEISYLFGFGYSMEHPDLLGAIKFCQSIGSVTGEFLQFDGMKFRTKAELAELLISLKAAGVRMIDLTFYGTETYHDRFAARKGDYRLMMDTLEQANLAGVDVSISIPLSSENAAQADALLEEIGRYHTARVSCFVPHAEGRGWTLDKVRLTKADYDNLSQRVKSHFNRKRFQTEQEWLEAGPGPTLQYRALGLTLTKENIDFFEQQSFEETIAYLEGLDETYYAAVPDFGTLMGLYGDQSSEQMYSARDLLMHYQRRYIAEHHLDVYDIHDERQCFSRHI